MGFERGGGSEKDKNYHFKDDLAYTEDDVLVYNIFAFNIPKKVTQDEAMTYFSQFGEVNQLRLVANYKKKSRKSAPKVGFIHYNNPLDAANVLKQTTPHTLKSKRISVRACDSWHQPHKYRSHDSTDSTTEDGDELASTSGKTYSLTVLNDDCLEHIVKKLELKDQVRFSLVCQRFRNIFEMVCKSEHKNHRVENLDALTLWEIREFFITAGPYIESLIGSVAYKYRKRVIEFISKFCPNIKAIHFDCSKLKSTLLMQLFEKLGHCTVVELNDCSLNDHAILSLKKLPKLESLSVAENYELTGRHMHLLTTLKNLILYGCGNIQSSHFVEICKSLTNLQKLDIQRCERLRPVAIREMVQHCQKLETLMLSCTSIPYENVANLPCLKKLELLYCSTMVPIRQQLFEELVEHKANQLEYLKICAKNCINLERANLIARLTSLKHLICSNNENLTDDCLRKFAELKNLEEIVLKNCRAITDVGLVYLVRKCTKLKKVNIQQCTHITDQFVINVIEVLNQTQNQRGKEPCVFQVARSGISSYMIHHAAYLAATSLIKLSYHLPLGMGIGNDDLYDNSDINDDDDFYDGYYLSDDLDDVEFDDDDPYDMFGAFSDGDEFDDDDLHHAYNEFGNFLDIGDDINDLLW